MTLPPVNQDKDAITLDPNFSTTRLVTQEKPVITNDPSSKVQSVLFLPPNPERRGEGGLRTKGYFKKSYDEESDLSGNLLVPRTLSFSQRPNFMIHLQSLMFFSPLLAPIYITLTTFCLLKIRYMKSNNLSIKDIWIYSMASNSLSFFVDSEYFIYQTLISSVFFFISYCFSLCLNEKKRKTYAEW